MSSIQIQRLQKDSEQLDNFIKQLQDRGLTEKIDGYIAKKCFLDNRIAELVGV